MLPSMHESIVCWTGMGYVPSDHAWSKHHARLSQHLHMHSMPAHVFAIGCIIIIKNIPVLLVYCALSLHLPSLHCHHLHSCRLTRLLQTPWAPLMYQPLPTQTFPHPHQMLHSPSLLHNQHQPAGLFATTSGCIFYVLFGTKPCRLVWFLCGNWLAASQSSNCSVSVHSC